MTESGEAFRPGGRLGPYEIERRLGEGGMCVVWKGNHRSLGKAVAIKVLKPDHAHKEVARLRFVQEGQALARIHHDNVIQVHDVGVVGESPYLVMDFLDGVDLAALFAARGILTPGELADVMIPVCAGVAAAHDERIVHRDIKPDNIFLARSRDGVVVPKVLDFGISRVTEGPERAETGTAAFMGTPRYMSPEQTRGAKHLDARTDQYSLGVVLYQGATGRLPIEETVLLRLLQRIERGEFMPPRALRWELPPEFEALILRAMANAPEHRFPTVRALGAALLPFAGERIRAIYGERLSGEVAMPAAALVRASQPAPWERASPRQAEGHAWAGPASAAPIEHTTLSDSVGEVSRPTPSRKRALWGRAVFLGLAAVSAAALGYVASLRRSPGQASRTSVMVARSASQNPGGDVAALRSTTGSAPGSRQVPTPEGAPLRVNEAAQPTGQPALTQPGDAGAPLSVARSISHVSIRRSSHPLRRPSGIAVDATSSRDQVPVHPTVNPPSSVRDHHSASDSLKP